MSQLTTRQDLTFDMDTTDESSVMEHTHTHSREGRASLEGDKTKDSLDSSDKESTALAEKLRTLHSRVMQHIHQVGPSVSVSTTFMYVH